MTSLHDATNGHSNNFKPTPGGNKPRENIDLETVDTTQFNFDGALIRMIVILGVPWFVAADVGRALGLLPHKGSYVRHLQKLDDDEKRQVSREAVSPATPPFNGGVGDTTAEDHKTSNGQATSDVADGPTMWVISESGLYTLILRSKGATRKGTVAHRFRGWVTKDILPAIRATGSYDTKALPSDPLATQLTEPGRYVVLVSPNKPPHVRLTSYDVSLDALALINAELLLNRIRTILCLWERAKLLRSTGRDPFETKVPGQLSSAIIDCRDLAVENAEMLLFPKKDVPDIPPD